MYLLVSSVEKRQLRLFTFVPWSLSPTPFSSAVNHFLTHIVALSTSSALAITASGFMQRKKDTHTHTHLHQAGSLTETGHTNHTAGRHKEAGSQMGSKLSQSAKKKHLI